MLYGGTITNGCVRTFKRLCAYTVQRTKSTLWKTCVFRPVRSLKKKGPSSATFTTGDQSDFRLEVEGVGTLHMAAPLTRRNENEHRAFETLPGEGHRIMWLSGGDLSMLKGLGHGLCGEHTVCKPMSKDKPHIDGCRFQKLQNMRSAFKDELKKSSAMRDADTKTWDRKHKLGYELWRDWSLDDLFGTYLEIVGMHDAEGVALMAWEMVLKKLRLMGMGSCAKLFNARYHPVTGQMGVWDRFNMVRLMHKTKVALLLRPQKRKMAVRLPKQ